MVVMKKRKTDLRNVPVFRRLREEAGLTQAGLAKLIPDKTRMKTISPQVISGWERGEYEPELTIPQIKALCLALNKSVHELPDDFGAFF
ncbi:MAG: helix-turn-helix transcriptional regulator [Alphaproteobacteria bacterium]